MTQDQWKAEHARLQAKFKALHESLKAKKQGQTRQP